MSVLQSINAIMERWLGRFLISLTVVMIATVLWQVLTRLLARIAVHHQWALQLAPSKWTEELASFLLAWIALLGGSLALRRGEHMGYDSLYLDFGFQGRARCLRFVQLCVILFGGLLLIGGAMLVSMTLELEQTTPALRWPMGLVYLAAPLSGLLIICFACERVYLAESEEELLMQSATSADRANTGVHT